MECAITGFVPTALFSAESFIAFHHGLSFVLFCAQCRNERGRGKGNKGKEWTDTGKRKDTGRDREKRRKSYRKQYQVAKEIR